MSEDGLSPRQEQVDMVIANLASTENGLDMLRASMEKAGFEMLKIIDKTHFPKIDDPAYLEGARKAVILDVETTGVDADDEITELGMTEFYYDETGIISIGRIFDQFNEPKHKVITRKIEKLTGITNEMVAGQKIDEDAVREILAGSDVIIAHNARFDRNMVEVNLPGCGFDNKYWCCSMDNVDWAERGKSSLKLELLVISEGGGISGFHRADMDCLGTAFILGNLNEDGKPAFVEMLENGRCGSRLIIAANAHFDDREILKKRGYKWSPQGGDATFGIKGWWTEIDETNEAKLAEEKFLRTEIFGGNDISLPSFRINAKTRYSKRQPGDVEYFRTQDVQALRDTSQEQESVQMIRDTIREQENGQDNPPRGQDDLPFTMG